MHSPLAALAAPLVLVLGSGVSGCAKSSDANDVGAATDAGDAQADSGPYVLAEGGPPTTAPQCADDNKDVFVIAEDRTLYSFHPPTAVFTNKGFLNCPTNGATPTSMAVDRTGVAWVRHSDGSVWRVDTETLVCHATAFQPQLDTFSKFGMGFSTDSSGGATEELFVSDSGGQGLATIDTKSLAFKFIGKVTGTLAGTTAELTGTGDGRLYGFFITSPTTIAEIAKDTGNVIPGTEHVLNGVSAGTAWAFSFYGGDFYVYTDTGDSSGLPQANGGSDVTKYSPSDGSVTVVKSKVGFKIVGAGVSTCAPTTTIR